MNKEKSYLIDGIEFKMSKLTLGQMQKIQELIKDNEITNIEAWIGLLRTKISQICSIILVPNKGVDFFDKICFEAHRDMLAEVVKDFFISYNPAGWLTQITQSLMPKR